MNSLRALQGTGGYAESAAQPSTSNNHSSEEEMSIDHTDANFNQEVEADDNGTNDSIMGRTSRNYGLDSYVDTDDDLGSFEGVAKQARVPLAEMTALEAKLFADILYSAEQVDKFIQFRNTILQLWYQNPKVQLLLDEILSCVKVSEKYVALFKRTFFYLEVHGMINFGRFRIIANPFKTQKLKVVVIGAGIAGLIAARQLKYFNFDVRLLEARKRIGGRINTYRQGKFAVDVGANMVPGMIGNPLRVINKQIKDMKLKSIKTKCPLYHGKKGELLDHDADERIMNMFNSILEATKLIAEEPEVFGKDNKPLSVGEAMEMVLSLHERHIKAKYLKHISEIIMLYKELDEKLNDLCTTRRVLQDMIAKQEEYISSRVQRSFKTEYMFRANRYEINKNRNKMKYLKKSIEKIEAKIREYENRDLPRHYLKPLENNVLEWHFASLEFATAAPLTDLDLKNWDKDEYTLEGEHLMASEGLACLPLTIGEDLEIQLSQVVRKINVLPDRVEVEHVSIEKLNMGNETKELAKKLATAPSTVLQADAVLCTLPLGVLKNCIDPKGEAAPNSIEFSPPLPKEKVDAIRAFGYGNVNKLVLIFDQVFWEPSMTLFGYVPETSDERGLFFMFWTLCGQQPVITALIAANVADEVETFEDEVIKERCLQQLRRSFGSKVSTLKSYYITRWRSDPWSMGTYSYCRLGASGKLCDTLATPIESNEDNGSKKSLPRLFFAGEHTSCDMMGTVHGAFLSGVREAANIFNTFIKDSPY